MATFYKYQERDPSSQINWAEVGANFSGMLMAEKETRENKKQAIDDATREQQRVIDNAVQGDSANMNQWTLDYAAEATEQLQMANRLLKSGSLSMKEYTMMRQNTSDGTDQAFTLAQEYQTEYADKMARANCKDPEKVGCSQQLELDMMASAEGFGNFSKSRLVIDPQSGKVMVGFYRENKEGVMELDSNPNNLVGINNLRNRIKSKADLYDMDGEVVKAAERFGEYEEVTRTIGSLYKKGQITITSDVTLRNAEIKKAVKDGKLTQEEADELNRISPGWDEIENAWLESQLSNNFNISSLLTNNLGQINGKTYEFTWDPNKVDETTILLKNVDGNAVPDFTTKFGKEQREDAKEGLRTVLRGALDHTVTVSAVSDSPGFAPASKTKANEENKDQDEIQRLWNELRSATPERRNILVNTILSSPRAQTVGLRSIKFTQIQDGFQPDQETPNMVDAVEYYYMNEAKNRTGENAVPIGTSLNDHASAFIDVSGITNPGRLGIGQNPEDSSSGSLENTSAGRDVLTGPNYVEKANEYIINKVSGVNGEPFAFDQKDQEFAGKFQAAFGSLGFKVTRRKRDDFAEKVTIEAPNGTEIDIYTNKEGDKAKSQQQNLIEFMISNVTAEAAEALNATGLATERQPLPGK